MKAVTAGTPPMDHATHVQPGGLLQRVRGPRGHLCEAPVDNWQHLRVHCRFTKVLGWRTPRFPPHASDCFTKGPPFRDPTGLAATVKSQAADVLLCHGVGTEGGYPAAYAMRAVAVLVTVSCGLMAPGHETTARRNVPCACKWGLHSSEQPTELSRVLQNF